MNRRARGQDQRTRRDTVATPRRRRHLQIRAPSAPGPAACDPPVRGRCREPPRLRRHPRAHRRTPAGEPYRRVPALAPADARLVRGRDRQCGIQPGQPFRDKPSRQPQRLQRRRQLQRKFDIGVFAAPSECGAKVVDFILCMFNSLLVTASRWRVAVRQPLTCSSRGGVRAPHRPRRTLRVSPMRTDAQSRAICTVFGHRCFLPPRVISRQATSADRELGNAPPRR